jgi:hypothetical protein
MGSDMLQRPPLVARLSGFPPLLLDVSDGGLINPDWFNRLFIGGGVFARRGAQQA